MPAIKTPIPSGVNAVTSFDEREVNAAVELLRNPSRLFRHRGGEPTNADLFEKRACELTGAKHALMVNSGTSALTCVLAGLDVGPGDDVIVPAYTYIATAACVMNVGAIPILAEIDDSLGMDPRRLRAQDHPLYQGRHRHAYAGRSVAYGRAARDCKKTRHQGRRGLLPGHRRTLQRRLLRRRERRVRVEPQLLQNHHLR